MTGEYEDMVMMGVFLLIPRHLEHFQKGFPNSQTWHFFRKIKE
jgi:hypothetical protein